MTNAALKTEAAPNDAVFLARQAIMDRDQNIHAYELLYRSARMGTADFSDANFATTKLITNTFLEIGIETISEDKPVFINLPRSYITGEIPLPLNPAKIVLEVLEDIEADEKTLQGLKALSDKGFTIALDDFVISENNSQFIQYADLIKVDITVFTKEQLVAEVNRLKEYDITLLAEKVETQDEYQLCYDLGFSYFQGYFFCKPNIIEGRQLPANQITLLNIIAKLQSPNTNIQEVEAIISNDVGISYKLLRIINSSLYNLGKNVESIQHALVLLGMNTLKKWLTLLSLSAVDNKPAELINCTLIRAKMCEEVANNLKLRSDAAFTVGMFSLLDALMDQPLEQIMSSLPLSDDITAAILEQKGPLGELLTAVQLYEMGKWEEIDPDILIKGQLNVAYEESIQWMTQILEELKK